MTPQLVADYDDGPKYDRQYVVTDLVLALFVLLAFIEVLIVVARVVREWSL